MILRALPESPGGLRQFLGALGLTALLSFRGLASLLGEEPKLAPEDNARGQALPHGAVRAKKARPAPSVDWLTLEVGLTQVRAKRLPALVLCDARTERSEAEAKEDGSGPKAAFFEDILTDTAMKDTVKRFVLIRVTSADMKKRYPLPPEKPQSGKAEAARKDAGEAPEKLAGGRAKAGGGDNPADSPDEKTPPVDSLPDAKGSIGGRLGLSGTQSAIVVLNYWEDSVLTYRESSPPNKSRAREELTRIWKVNLIYAEEAHKVEPEVEKSKYSAKLGNQRDAVLRVKGYEDPRTQTKMDPNLRKDLNSLIQVYKAKAQKAIEQANKLDAAKKYSEAIQAFDKIMVDFPFKDVLEQANRRKNECLRKMTLGF